jgi:hypothetical protein
MSGLKKLCRLYGKLQVKAADGRTIVYVWDYAQEEAVLESEMPFGSERWQASERVRWRQISSSGQ